MAQDAKKAAEKANEKEFNRQLKEHFKNQLVSFDGPRGRATRRQDMGKFVVSKNPR